MKCAIYKYKNIYTNIYMSDSSNDTYEDSFSSHSTSDMIGEIVNNKYVLLYKLGQGAFASVFLTLNLSDKKYYAIKMQDSEESESAYDEINLLKKFNSEKCKYLNNLIESFSCEVEDVKYICMVLQLMAGSAYDITRVGSLSHGLPLCTVKQIIKQLLIAMDVIQSKKYNLLHSDIKPENILIVGQNNKVRELIQIYSDKKFATVFNTKLGKVNKAKIKKTIQDLDLKVIETKYSKDKSNNIEFIDPLLLKNIEIKLADFGNCKSIDHERFDIQTRYYRAPEIIMGYEYDFRCDVWSVGCVLYELMTGQILFDPQKTDRFSTDRDHIHKLISTLGKIPDDLIQNSKYGVHFFKVNGQLKGNVPELKFTPLYDRVRTTLKDRPEYTDDQLFLVTDLIYKLLNYYPHNRPTIKEILTHKFFS